MQRFFTILLLAIIFLLIHVPGGLSAPYVHFLGDEQEKSTEKQRVTYDTEQLNRDKILITNQGYRQIFEPYLNPNSSIFITSDTVLSAFHVLFRQSIADMEQVNANRALNILKQVWSEIAPEEKKITKPLEIRKFWKTGEKSQA